MKIGTIWQEHIRAEQIYYIPRERKPRTYVYDPAKLEAELHEAMKRLEGRKPFHAVEGHEPTFGDS